MPNIGKVIKQEISRISRKESKVAVSSLRKASGAARHVIAELKRKVLALEKAVQSLAAQRGSVASASDADAAEEGRRVRVTAKGLRSLRSKLGLSGDEFGKLLGITSQAVYTAERKEGALRLRSKTRDAYLAIRDLGAREARELLAQQAASKVKAKAAPKSKAKGKGRKSKAA